MLHPYLFNINYYCLYSTNIIILKNARMSYIVSFLILLLWNKKYGKLVKESERIELRKRKISRVFLFFLWIFDLEESDYKQIIISLFKEITRYHPSFAVSSRCPKYWKWRDDVGDDVTYKYQHWDDWTKKSDFLLHTTECEETKCEWSPNRT